mgnify:CR=1 FL=1
MNLKLIKAGILSGIPLLLTGCVDNDYDLSNIDTTSEIKVNDLVLPVNIDAITLNDIFDIDDESEIKPVTINGREFYAVTKHGDINSQSIDIPVFSTTTPDVPETNAAFKLELQQPATRAAQPTLEFFYDLDSFDPQVFKIEASGIDEAVREIKILESKPMLLKLEFKETQLPSYISLYFNELKMRIAKGLIFNSLPSNYTYDPNSGDLTITGLDCPDKSFTLSLTANGIDFTKSDTEIKNGHFQYSDEVEVISGRLKTTVDLSAVSATDFSPTQEIDFNVKTTIGSFEATHFTGMVEYHLTGDGLNISPVDLTGIPEFLGQEGTDLKLANPQIYLNLNNPVAAYNLYYQTGLQLVAGRQQSSIAYSPDNGKLIATAPLNPGPYNFLLSPAPADPLPEYAAGLQHIPFSGLSEILSGDGLPQLIEIKLINPELPYQAVDRFELGQPISGISGTYDFIAPIALKNGSKIIYSDSKDGWNDEDIDKINISVLQVEADVTSTIPLDANLVAYPLAVGNKKITGAKAECTIPANAKDNHIVIKMTGPIEHLDGITFEAVLSPGSEDSLSPQQTITLKNLRAKVSGSYTTEF